jgi:hypothetical protein|tara:strand:+ start:88 stop:270 length:183 start_codon:yes stop_codon:yes gene_type:complete
MTLQELINKLNYLTDHRMTKDFSTNQNSDVHFFVEDDYNTIDVKIENVEVDEVEGKIYLS